MGRNNTDTKVKQVTQQNKTRKQTDHDSTPPLKGLLPGDPYAKNKESQLQIGWVEGSQEEGTKNVFWRPAILEACNGEDPQVAGIGEDEGEVEGGPLLEGLDWKVWKAEPLGKAR